MGKRRPLGITILIAMEILVLVAVAVCGALRMLAPKEDKRTINTTEATEQATEITTEETVAETEAVATEVETYVPAELSEDIEADIAKMPLEEKVSLLFVVSPESLTGEDNVNIAGEVTRSALSSYHIGGLSYNYKNYENETQIRDLLNNTRNMALTALGYKPIMFASDATGDAVVYATGDDMEAMCEALGTEKGVSAVTNGDSVKVIAHYPADSRVTEATDIVIFEATTETAEDEEAVPVCMSAERVLGFRTANDYNGIIMTGKLDAESVTGQYSAAEAAITAVKAGVDMIYEPESFTEAYDAVVAAVGEGEIEEETIDMAVGRILSYMKSAENQHE